MPQEPRHGQAVTFADVDTALRDLSALGDKINMLNIFGDRFDPDGALTRRVKKLLEADCGGVQQGWQRNIVHPLLVQNVPIGPLSVAQHQLLTGYATRLAVTNGISGRFADTPVTLILAAAVHDYHPPIWKHTFEDLMAYAGKSAKAVRDAALRGSSDFEDICGAAGAGLEDVIGAIGVAEAVDHLAQEVSEYPPFSQFVIPTRYLLGAESVFNQIRLDNGRINFSGNVPIVNFNGPPRQQMIQLSELPNRLRHARRLHVKPSGTGSYGGLGIMIQSSLRDAYMRAFGIEWSHIGQVSRDSLSQKIEDDLLGRARDTDLPGIFDRYVAEDRGLQNDPVFMTAWKFLHYNWICGIAGHKSREGKHEWPALRTVCALYTEQPSVDWHSLVKDPARKFGLIAQLHAEFGDRKYARHGLVIDARSQNNYFGGTMFEGEHKPFGCGSVVVYVPASTKEARAAFKGMQWQQIEESARARVLSVLEQKGIYFYASGDAPQSYAQPHAGQGPEHAKGSAEGLRISGRPRMRHIDPRFKNPGNGD
jgi:hypothetical protein